MVKLWQKMLLLACGMLFAAGVQADIPKETYDALKLDKSATSKQLYEALVKRYKDPAQGSGRGQTPSRPRTRWSKGRKSFYL